MAGDDSCEQASTERQATQGHLTTNDIGKLSTRANVKTVVLSHMSFNPSGDYSAQAAEVKKNFPGQVLIAKDLMEF